MRIYQILLMISLASFFSCQAIEKATNKQEVKTLLRQFSSEEILFDPLLKPLSEYCANQSLTLIFLNNVPKNEKVLKAHLSRKLLKEYKASVTEIVKSRGETTSRGKSVLNSLKKMTDEYLIDLEVGEDSDSLLVVSEIGYFPGEKIDYRIYSTKSGKTYCKGQFIPRPIHIFNEAISTDVELKTILPNSYNISIKQTANNEKFVFSATSCDYREEIPYTDKIKGISYFPRVVGTEGGLANCTIKNSSNKEISFTLPWGLDIFSYGEPNIVYSPQGPRFVNTPSQQQTVPSVSKPFYRMRQLLNAQEQEE
jgi:hypothetical protein